MEGALLVFSHKSILVHDEMSTEKVVWSWNNFLSNWVFSDLIKYSFPYREDPFGINFFKTLVDIILNWTESSFLNKLLSDCLTWKSFVMKSTDCSQEGDMIIHKLRQKTKWPLGILRKSRAGKSHDVMTSWTTSYNENSGAREYVSRRNQSGSINCWRKRTHWSDGWNSSELCFHIKKCWRTMPREAWPNNSEN